MQIMILLTELQQVKRKLAALAVYSPIYFVQLLIAFMFLPQQPPACNEENIQAVEKSLSEQQALTILSIACECV